MCAFLIVDHDTHENQECRTHSSQVNWSHLILSHIHGTAGVQVDDERMMRCGFHPGKTEGDQGDHHCGRVVKKVRRVDESGQDHGRKNEYHRWELVHWECSFQHQQLLHSAVHPFAAYCASPSVALSLPTFAFAH